MNNRLQQFLELENLSPARLADILGVQRSGMSHILSGRNKPGYEFIHKLLTKFPDLSADWFITGKGKPYKKGEETQIWNAPLKNSQITPELMANSTAENTDETPDIKSFTSEKEIPQPRENQNLAGYKEVAKDKRSVKRVVIFYNDGSFEELYPAGDSISDF